MKPQSRMNATDNPQARRYAQAEIKIVRLLIPGPMKSIEISERTGIEKNRTRQMIARLKCADVVRRLPRSTLIGLTIINE